MPKNIVNRIDRNLARRLKEARREMGLSTRAVVERLPRRFVVSHSTIASYENGTAYPPITVLAALATTYQRTLNWFLDNRRELSGFRYWNLRSRVRLADKRQFEALVGRWTDAYVNLETRLKSPLRKEIVLPMEGWNGAPQQLAASVRKAMRLDDAQPIQSTIALLEMFAIRVLELRSALQIDGVAAKHGDSDVVVVNPDLSNERIRMNVTNELAHFLFQGAKHQFGWSNDFLERQEYDFATSLLIPDSQLEVAFADKSFIRLVEFRERFGISLAAMIDRAEKLRIINSTRARRLWAEMADYARVRSGPGLVWRDRAVRFEMLMEGAIESKTLTWEMAEEVTGIREGELRNRISSATGRHVDGRREEKGGVDEVRILRLAVGYDEPPTVAAE